MIWTHTELEDDDSDHWFQPLPELSFQLEDSSTTTPTAPTTISAEVPISISSDGSLESQQQQHTSQEEQFETPQILTQHLAQSLNYLNSITSLIGRLVKTIQPYIIKHELIYGRSARDRG